MTTNTASLTTFARSYIETALWSSVDEDGHPLDQASSSEDLSEGALKQMVRDCEEFQANYSDHLAAVAQYCDDHAAGHNFWLNRNGHGAGFWDIGYGGDKAVRASLLALSEASKCEGSCDLYVADDGLIYVA